LRRSAWAQLGTRPSQVSIISPSVSPYLFFQLITANSLRKNSITAAGARALGPLCPDKLAIDLDTPLGRIFADELNKARLIRQFGSTPLKRFRLYVCGFGGAFVCFRVLDRSDSCVDPLTSRMQRSARRLLPGRWSAAGLRRCGDHGSAATLSRRQRMQPPQR
jgi:hypothetical protein